MPKDDLTEVLVLYYSRNGATAALARQVATGVEKSGAIARVRTVPPITSRTDLPTLPAIPESGPLYVTEEDLRSTHGLILGSPTRFGNMAAPLKYFIDSTSGLWAAGTLVDRPFGLFTSTGSLHGGQETTLLSMALPLIHHGMLWVGVPFTQTELSRTRSGGTPYGASHVSGDNGHIPLQTEERKIAEALGMRVGRMAEKLRRNRD